MKALRAFTLLEVMVAMAILALGLTTILSSQTGLFATTRRVQNETIATSLVRCKMSELEIDLAKDGFPLLDEKESGPCCEDEPGEFTCEWRVETIELPQPESFELGEGEEEDVEDLDDATGLDLANPGSSLSTALPFAGSSLSSVAGVDDVAGMLGESSEESSAQGGIVGMALGMVYPTLKPMLEASIRKLTVRVVWHEGSKEQDLEVVQYLTNPMEGSLNPNAADGLEGLLEQLGQTGDLGASDGTASDGAASDGPSSPGAVSP